MTEATTADVTALSQSIGLTERLAYWSARHRWTVVLLSIAVVALGMLSVISVGTIIGEGGGVGESGG